MAGLSNIGSVIFPPNAVSPNEKARAGGLSANSKTKGLGGLLEDDLSAEEKRVVQELRQRDLEVRQHEQAHMAAAGGMRGAAPTTPTPLVPTASVMPRAAKSRSM